MLSSRVNLAIVNIAWLVIVYFLFAVYEYYTILQSNQYTHNYDLMNKLNLSYRELFMRNGTSSLGHDGHGMSYRELFIRNGTLYRTPLGDNYMYVVGTIPGKESVELRREQQPRTASGSAKARVAHPEGCALGVQRSRNLKLGQRK